MYYTTQAANNKGADQTVQMRRLICTFVVRMAKTGFLVTWLNYESMVLSIVLLIPSTWY